jgi:hypothetical protein
MPMKGDAATVANYIAKAPAWARGTLRELRRAIRTVAPEARRLIISARTHVSYEQHVGPQHAFASGLRARMNALATLPST